jgi:hypothetical protein
LGHEVAEAAVTVAELLRHFRDRTVFQKDSPQGFITAVQGFSGLAEKGFAKGVVHGSTLRNVIALFRVVSWIAMGRSGSAGKGQRVGSASESRVLRGGTAKGGTWCQGDVIRTRRQREGR